MGDAVRGINRTYAGISDPGYNKTQAQSPLPFRRCELGTMADQSQKYFAFRREAGLRKVQHAARAQPTPGLFSNREE